MPSFARCERSFPLRGPAAPFQRCSERNEAGSGAGYAGVTSDATLAARVNAALAEVRPAIARDGGDVWLVRVDGTTALVQMVGACGGCAMSTSTLRGLIETTVVARCPEITAVEQA
jgi:Fe-S cluster biogenesis protein NfuA